jgi:dTDP-4-dehydrorhamnose reductase
LFFFLFFEGTELLNFDPLFLTLVQINAKINNKVANKQPEKTMKILITGGSGLLGQYLNIELSKKNQILTQYFSNTGNCPFYNSVRFSITDYTAFEKIFSSFMPDVVVHAAAISNAEKADSVPARTVYEINVNATKRIAELCAENNARMIYLSTDLVYAGDRGSFLKENAKLMPVSLYAETKLMGELKVRETFENYIILREALLFGFGLNHARNNFHLTYESLASNKLVRLFVDQFRSPISLKDASGMISRLIEKGVSGETFNFGGRERLSRYELGEIICEETGFDKNLLAGITMEEAGLIYKVADVSLNTAGLKSAGVEAQSVRESIRELLFERI